MQRIQGLLFSWAFSQNGPLQLAMAVKLECQKGIVHWRWRFVATAFLNCQLFYKYDYIDIINEEWCIELNLNLKNAWM